MIIILAKHRIFYRRAALFRLFGRYREAFYELVEILSPALTEVLPCGISETVISRQGIG